MLPWRHEHEAHNGSVRTLLVGFADVIALALVVPALAALQFLVPEATRRAAFAASATESFVTVAAAAYLHLSVSHLLSNVSSYVLYVALGYALAWYIGRRRWFGVAAGGCFVVAPAVTTVSVVHVVRLTGIHPQSLVVGFSGVASAVVGVVFVAWTLVLTRRYGRRIGFLLGWLGIAVAVAYLLFLSGTGFPPVERTMVLSFLLFPVVALAGLLAYRLSLGAESDVKPEDSSGENSETGPGGSRAEIPATPSAAPAGTLLIGGYLCSVGVVAVTLFPASAVDGTTLSALVHGLGFLTGIGVALVVFVLLGSR